jgi:hypothetical protein
MSFIFSQSALVFGASAANAGAETASSKPAMIAVLKILADIGAFLLLWVILVMTARVNVRNRDDGVRGCGITNNDDNHGATSSGGGASGDASTLG